MARLAGRQLDSYHDFADNGGEEALFFVLWRAVIDLLIFY